MLISAFLTIETGFHLSYEILEHAPEAFGIIFLELGIECIVGPGIDPSELWKLLPEGKWLREVWIAVGLVQFCSQDKDYSCGNFRNWKYFLGLPSASLSF